MNELEPAENKVLDEEYLVEQARKYTALSEDIRELTARKKEIGDELIEYMDDIKTVEGAEFTITKIPAGITNRIDTAKMKKEGIYNNYLIEGERVASIRITPKAR